MRYKNCVFCQIIEERYKDPESLFLVVNHKSHIELAPLNPVTPGHMLVLPTEHARGPMAWADVTGACFDAATRVASELGYDSYNLIASEGKDATQSIFHLHVHIVPRRPDDGLHLPWTGQIKDEDKGRAGG